MLAETPDQIRAAVRAAGVVGAGGAGFPTYVKLNAKVDTVIANGSECEPLLHSDKTLMRQHPELVVEGMKIVMKTTGATDGIIAVKGCYTDVVNALEHAIPAGSGIRLHKLDNYYPAGDEFLTVYDTTGRVIPEGGIPLHVGVVVSNVLSLVQVYQATQGAAVTRRLLTVTGDVNKPQVLDLPIGTTYRDIVELAGGVTIDDPVLIDGGPMMGKIVEDWDLGIKKTTSGMIVLPKDHFLIRMATTSLSQMVKLSKAACCQCFRCSDLCPRNQLGHELYPHRTMRTIDYNIDDPTKDITSAFLCSQCGLCELVACDFMQLSPRKIYAEYRRLLVEAGVKNPHTRSDFPVHSQYENRKVSIPTVIKKLGITEYGEKDVPFMGERTTSVVRILLSGHIGAPAVPIVALGTEVNIGDLIASSPESALGSNYHASIVGTVTVVTPDFIEITAGR